MPQLAAMLVTFALEAPVAALGARVLGTKRAWWWSALAAVLGSALTHPLVWALNEAWAQRGGGWALKIAALECGAALLESAAYVVCARLAWPRALLLSAAANAFSFGVGLALYRFGVL